MTSREYKKVMLVALLILLAFIVGVLIGYFSRLVWIKSDERSELFDKLNREADESITQKLYDEIDTEQLDKTLRKLIKHPRLGGTKHSTDAAYYVHQEFLKYGLDSKIVEYNVTLSYPDKIKDNFVAVVQDEGKEVFRSTSTAEGDEVIPYNAFSPSGHVTGNLIFVNYARKRDFQLLNQKGLNCTGAIVIAKYGKGFRGYKVHNAYGAGATGIILYSDPADYAQYRNISGTYPDSIFLPEDGVQLGNIVLNKGDQATPGYPANDYAYRMNKDKIKDRLPQIPCLPISYGDAYNILSLMEGEEVPAEWKGHLNITYRFGGTLKDSMKVVLKVSNKLEHRKIYNVIGKIEGEIDPDRYVLVGNHRDAWVYGSLDPASGSITLMEMARVYGHLQTEGWRPRRTIMFCSWDAEEFGLVGSYEWVEDNVKLLISNAVAYVNMDSTVSGNATINLQTVPFIQRVFEEAAKKAADPHEKAKNVYEAWVNHPWYRVKHIGGGSDHVPFISKAGVPAVSTEYFGVNKIWKSTTSPLYHTRYESYAYYKQIDPEMKFSKTITFILSEMVRNLADSRIIPFDVVHYAEYVSNSVSDGIDKYREFLENKSMEYLQKSANEFYEASIRFKSLITTDNGENPVLTRKLNDRLMWLERTFLSDEGLPGNSPYKHVLHSPGGDDYYAGISFPGISQIEECSKKDAHDINCRDEIQKHFATIIHLIFSAAKVLDGKT